jgi:hypothetical protein
MIDGNCRSISGAKPDGSLLVVSHCALSYGLKG